MDPLSISLITLTILFFSVQGARIYALSLFDTKPKKEPSEYQKIQESSDVIDLTNDSSAVK